ncbi:ferrous iron transport protein B [Peptococcus simiae]
MKTSKTIALLGQPNSGKSTVFNQLTGAHQHVGNWPGKTVEKVEGSFVFKGQTYSIVDLPGTYSLSAHSDEEVVTRDYIASGAADLVCILADASQLERSLFMLADYAGIRMPALLVLTMMDVADKQGKRIDFDKLAKKLGIPVLPLVGTDPASYEALYLALEEGVARPRYLSDEALVDCFQTGSQQAAYAQALALVPAEGLDLYSPTWLAAKLLEGDRPIAEALAQAGSQGIQAFLTANPDGSLYTGDCKFAWIEALLADCVDRSQSRRRVLGRFDRWAISKKWGKAIAIGIVLLGVMASMLVAAPIMVLGGSLPLLLKPLVIQTGLPPVLTSFINGTLMTTLGWVASMAGFVFGINLVFGLIEEVGYMARVSYVFDHTMNRLGLQGKSIMPMLVSFGCTIGGAAGTRVIDSYSQRILTIALAWAVPCGATFAVVPTLATAFFGGVGGFLVIVLIFIIMFIHIKVTAMIFGRTLSPVAERTGLIMELPPYHKPRWKGLLKTTLVRSFDVFKKAFVVVFFVSALFWALTYSADGDMTGTVLYRFGQSIEPVTRFFGMGWQTFLAFLASMISKEAVLGVTGVLFSHTGSIFEATTGAGADAHIGHLLAASISKAEALAFIIAVTFNVPCLMALNATLHETHSAKWTLRIALYYVATALVLSALTYHISSLFF